MTANCICPGESSVAVTPSVAQLSMTLLVFCRWWSSFVHRVTIALRAALRFYRRCLTTSILPVVSPFCARLPGCCILAPFASCSLACAVRMRCAGWVLTPLVQAQIDAKAKELGVMAAPATCVTHTPCLPWLHMWILVCVRPLLHSTGCSGADFQPRSHRPAAVVQAALEDVCDARGHRRTGGVSVQQIRRADHRCVVCWVILCVGK